MKPHEETLLRTNAYTSRYRKLKQSTRTAVEQFLTDHANTVWVSWSGGKDSTAALLLCLQVTPHIPVVFFNSGLEYPENLTYIQNMKDELNINLHAISPEVDAFTLLQESGLWSHTRSNETTPLNDEIFHTTLITKPAQQACNMFGSYNVTGLRVEESQGRRLLLSKNQGQYTTKAGVSTLCPLWRWKDVDVRTFLQENGAPENPVYAKLSSLNVPERQRRVGMIFDGNALETGRLVHIKNGWPELWTHLVMNFPRIEEWT